MSVVLIFAGCGGADKDRSVGTDMVDIPFSADGDREKKMPAVTFDTTDVHLGRMLQGDVGHYTYNFTNTGEAPLVISNISASCGCTVAKKYPRGKIMPGEGGAVEVEYDSQSKWGEQVSVISLTVNTIPNRIELALRANVIAPDKP